MSDSPLTEPGLDLGHLRQAIQEEYTAVARLKRVVLQNSGHKVLTSARKAAYEEEWNAARASLACEVSIRPTAVLGADAFSDAGDKGESEP